MSLLLIVVIAILAIGLFIGWKKGLIKMLFAACTLIGALVLSFILSPPLAKSLQANESIMDFFIEKVDTTMDLKERAKEFSSKEDFLKEINLPENMKELFDSEEFLEKLEIDSDIASEKLAVSMTEFLAKMIVYAICYVGIFIIALILLFVVGKLANLLAKLPLLKQANAVAGMALGLLQALIIVWLLFALLTAMSTTSIGQSAMEAINDNGFLRFLYGNNLIMNFMTSKVKGLF